MRITWGFWILLAYSLFAVSMIGFAIFASRQPVELVTKAYYERATHYQEDIVAIANAQRSPLRLSYVPTMQSMLLTGDSTTVQIDGVISFYKPDGADKDFSVPFNTGKTGCDTIVMADISHGAWRVLADWTAAGKKHHSELRIYVP